MLERLKSYFIGDKLSRMSEHHDRVRTITNYHFSLVLFLGFLFSLIPVFISENAEILQIPVFSGLAFSVLILFGNKFIYSARGMGLLFVVFGLSVAFSNLFLNTEVLHLGVPLWILLVLLYSFYNVGVIWSIVVALFSVSVYVFWVVYFLDDEVQRVADKIKEITPDIVLEMTTAYVTLTAMILVYIKAIYSKERQLTLKNKQMILKQQAVEEEQNQFAKQVQESTKNMHEYFSTANSFLEKNQDSTFLKNQLTFASIVFKVFSKLSYQKVKDPGALITSTLSASTSSFGEGRLSYTFDNTIEFIEERYMFPLSMVLSMLVYASNEKTEAMNIAVSYFFENENVVMRYQDDGKPSDTEDDKLREQISSVILSEVGAEFISKRANDRSLVEIRFPL